MLPKNKIHLLFLSVVFFWMAGCEALRIPELPARKNLPTSFGAAAGGDSLGLAAISWRDYFQDPLLSALIDSALKNNQELHILTQEIAVLRNEVSARKGEYLPFVGLGAGAGWEKEGRFTRLGALEEQLEVEPGTPFPNPLGDVNAGAVASWELDIWKKLRNARQAAAMRYLAGSEGRNFLVTRLVAEIATAYYELLALDNLLEIIEKNIQLQANALNVVKQQKEAARVSQLAVNRFEAQYLNTMNLQFEIRQRITEAENRIRFLTGDFSLPVRRSPSSFADQKPPFPSTGVPAQLLTNRPDIRRAEAELAAAGLDVRVARADFFPSVGLRAGWGFHSFNPRVFLHPESFAFDLAGDLITPLVNRNAIRAAYQSASARQAQALYTYEQSVLTAYLDVLNHLSQLDNFTRSYETKAQEAEILSQSVGIASNLFNSARADYAEVLLTQREALEARMQLTEVRLLQLHARVELYRALGGGWR